MLALLVSLGKPFLEAPLWKVSNVANGGGSTAKSSEINRQIIAKLKGCDQPFVHVGVAQTLAPPLSTDLI